MRADAAAMNTNTRVPLQAIAATVLGIAAFVAHNAGVFAHEGALLAAKSATEVKGSLDDLARGTYTENQAVALFCSASASLDTDGTLPEEMTSWRDFVAARVGVTTDSEDYFEGKLAQLGTAIDLAQRNPQYAVRYARACALR
jgi:hypothetical protein